MNKMNLAWAAGFFDGEGCIQFEKYVRIVVSQKDIKALTHFRNIFNMGEIRQRNIKTPSGNPTWIYRYEIYGSKATTVLSILLPYLIGSKLKAIEAIKKQSSVKDMKSEPQRLSYILQLRKEKQTFETIGQLFNVSRQRAHQLYNLALKSYRLT